MIELSISEITFSLLGGGHLGLVFFGGLKLTIEYLNRTRYPALLFICSLLLRFMLVLIVAYWLIMQIHWQALPVALTGFICARLVLTRTPATGASQ